MSLIQRVMADEQDDERRQLYVWDGISNQCHQTGHSGRDGGWRWGRGDAINHALPRVLSGREISSVVLLLQVDPMKQKRTPYEQPNGDCMPLRDNAYSVDYHEDHLQRDAFVCTPRQTARKQRYANVCEILYACACVCVRVCVHALRLRRR